MPIPDQFVRFRIEAEAVAQLRHPDIGTFTNRRSRGLPFVSLEFLDGGSLAKRLASNPQPGRPAAEFMAILAGAVHVAHKPGSSTATSACNVL